MQPHNCRLLLASVFCVAGCRLADGPPPPLPQVSLSSATINPSNSLSTLLTVKSTYVDSVRIVYSTSDGVERRTPFTRVTGAVTRLATLGLTPSTPYSHVVDAYGPGGHVIIGPFVITSGTLPVQLAGVKLDISGTPTNGYLLTSLTVDSVTTALVAFDSTGAVRWYRFFASPAGQDAQQQHNGDFTIFLGTSRGFDPTRGNFVEVTPTGEVARTLSAPEPLYTDGHELLLTFRDTSLAASHFFGYDRRLMTVPSPSGPVDSIVAVHTIVRLRPDGSADWRFPVENIISPADCIEPPSCLGDIDHPNSLTLDLKGNYIISFRNAGEITSIDSSTSTVLWRLGGAHNQFTFVNDPLNGFSAQHFVRVLPNGHLLLFDNGWRHQPQESRAVEYVLDVASHTATMVWQYRHAPPLFAQFLGSVQRLANSNTLVGWGYFGIVTEVDSLGNTVWEGTLSNGSRSTFYRMLKIASLYRYETP